MSHKATVILGEFNLELLKQTFESLAWQCLADTTAVGVYGTFPYVAKNPEAAKTRYDIGIQVDAKKKVSLEWDSDLRLQDTALGKDFSILKRDYQVFGATRYTNLKKGVVRNQKVMANQDVVLELEIDV